MQIFHFFSTQLIEVLNIFENSSNHLIQIDHERDEQLEKQCSGGFSMELHQFDLLKFWTF
jgi:hypothetical protein